MDVAEYTERLLRIATNWRRGLLTDKEYIEQTTFLAVEFAGVTS